MKKVLDIQFEAPTRYAKGGCLSALITPNTTYPLIYFRKPKWLTDQQFDRIKKSLSIVAPPDVIERIINEYDIGGDNDE